MDATEESELYKRTETTLRSRYSRQIAELRRGTCLVINHADITSPILADTVISNKESADCYFRQALSNIGVEDKYINSLIIRYINLPSKTAISNLKSSLVGQTRSFDGIVRRVSAVKSKATEIVFECPICTARVSVPQTEDITYPESKCANCYNKTKWKVVVGAGKYIDYQSVLVQEFPESVRSGDQPKNVTVTLTRELCNNVIPGNRINVCGVLKLKKIKGENLVFEPYVEGNSISLLDESYDSVSLTDEDLKVISEISKTPDLFDKISNSISPTVFGHEDVKRGIALQLFGGVTKNINGSRIRGDIHVLLVGDPGIAKSVIMKNTTALIPRGVFTQGYSASKAGLTATAIKDEEGQWVLDAGALVLASGGMCAVDELDKMNDFDRVALHGAMEQQEIDIAKAGIVAKLYTRCSLLGAANPKLGRFDIHGASLSSQFNLAPTLLSRFDLIFALTDTPESTRDGEIADYILNTHMGMSRTTIEPALLRKYIAHARTITPKLNKEAVVIIKEYYTKVRGMANQMQTVPITARSLEGLVRLSEAAARMRLSDTVSEDDARLVVNLVDSCLRKVAYDAKTGAWDIDKVVSRYPAKSRSIIPKITDAIILLNDNNRGCPLQKLCEFMKTTYNIEESDVKANIELLRAETKVYSPRDGWVKLMKDS